MISRRSVLKGVPGAVAWAALSGRGPWAQASALGVPIGLELYSVRELLPKDYEGTLRQVAALGYREVEAAGYYGHTAAQVKQAMSAAGLHCVSAHYPYNQLANLDEVIAFARELGLSYIICSSPGFKDPDRVKGKGYGAMMNAMTLDDWRWNAEQFNRIGTRVKAEGMQFGYHNHTMEFRPQNGTLPYDELLRLTDPAKVTMEMDCGWVVVGGQSPVAYLKRYPQRFSMLHVKDFKMNGNASPSSASTTESQPPPSTELGRGSIDYKPIFAAAKAAGVKHCFVEQEEFDMAPMAALKIDADYMRDQPA